MELALPTRHSSRRRNFHCSRNSANDSAFALANPLAAKSQKAAFLRRLGSSIGDVDKQRAESVQITRRALLPQRGRGFTRFIGRPLLEIITQCFGLCNLNDVCASNAPVVGEALRL